MKTDKLLQLIQQKKFMRSGGALPLPKAQLGTATRADSLAVYNNAVALDNFYKKELAKKSIVVSPNDPRYPGISRTAKINPNNKKDVERFKQDIKNLRQDNSAFYRDEINQRVSGAGRWPLRDKYYKDEYNLSNNDLLKIAKESYAKTSIKDPNKVYYRDIITGQQNLASPLAVLDNRILPQDVIEYAPGSQQLLDSYPGGSVVIYRYDPIAVKPYDILTKEEKKIRDKKYPKDNEKPLVNIRPIISKDEYDGLDLLQKDQNMKLQNDPIFMEGYDDEVPITLSPDASTPSSPYRMELNPAFSNSVDNLPNRTKEAVVDSLGNPRYKYYNGDKVISEKEYRKLSKKALGGASDCGPDKYWDPKLKRCIPRNNPFLEYNIQDAYDYAKKYNLEVDDESKKYIDKHYAIADPRWLPDQYNTGNVDEKGKEIWEDIPFIKKIDELASKNLGVSNWNQELCPCSNHAKGSSYINTKYTPEYKQRVATMMQKDPEATKYFLAKCGCFRGEDKNFSKETTVDNPEYMDKYKSELKKEFDDPWTNYLHSNTEAEKDKAEDYLYELDPEWADHDQGNKAGEMTSVYTKDMVDDEGNVRDDYARQYFEKYNRDNLGTKELADIVTNAYYNAQPANRYLQVKQEGTSDKPWENKYFVSQQGEGIVSDEGLKKWNPVTSRFASPNEVGEWRTIGFDEYQRLKEQEDPKGMVTYQEFNKKKGGSLPKAQQGILDYYVNKSKEQKKTQSTGGCPPGFIKDPITKNCKPDTSRIPDINQKSDENLDQYLYLTNQLTPIERIKFEVVRSLKKIRGNDPTAPKTPLIQDIRQTGGQEGILPKAQDGEKVNNKVTYVQPKLVNVQNPETGEIVQMNTASDEYRQLYPKLGSVDEEGNFGTLNIPEVEIKVRPNVSGCVAGMCYEMGENSGKSLDDFRHRNNLYGDAWTILNNAYGTDIKLNPKDFSNLKVNDVVNLTREAFDSDAEKGIPAANQHVGFISKVVDGVPYVKHFINHQYYEEPINDISAVFKYQPTKVKRLPDFEDLNVQPSSFKFDEGYEPNNIEEGFLKGSQQKPQLQKILSLNNDDYDNLEKLAYGIMYNEGKFGRSKKTLYRMAVPDFLQKAVKVADDMRRGVDVYDENINNLSQGYSSTKESTLHGVSKTDKNDKRTPAEINKAIKEGDYSGLERTNNYLYYVLGEMGLNADNLENGENSYKAVMANLSWLKKRYPNASNEALLKMYTGKKNVSSYESSVEKAQRNIDNNPNNNLTYTQGEKFYGALSNLANKVNSGLKKVSSKTIGTLRDALPTPITANALLGDIAGSKEPITEKSLSSVTLDKLKEIVKNQVSQGKYTLDYNSYFPELSRDERLGISGGDKDQTGMSEKISRAISPGGMLQNFLGQATIVDLGNGEYEIVDTYDFNDKGKSLGVMDDIVKRGASPYAISRAIGRNFGSQDNQGAPVRIRVKLEEGGSLPKAQAGYEQAKARYIAASNRGIMGEKEMQDLVKQFPQLANDASLSGQRSLGNAAMYRNKEEADRVVTNTLGQVISTPASRLKAQREEIVARRPEVYNVQDYKMGIQEPGAPNDITDDPVAMAIIGTATGGVGLGAEGFTGAASRFAGNLASEATLGAYDLTHAGLNLGQRLAPVRKAINTLNEVVKNPTTGVSRLLYPKNTVKGDYVRQFNTNFFPKNFNELETVVFDHGMAPEDIARNIYNDAHTGITTLDDQIKQKLSELNTHEGYRRVYKQEEDILKASGFTKADLTGNYPAGMTEDQALAYQASINANKTLDRLNRTVNHNDLFTNQLYRAYKANNDTFTYTDLDNAITKFRYPLFNAHAHAGAHPPYLMLGYGYGDDIATANHEINHILQGYKWETQIDKNLKNLEIKTSLTPAAAKDYNYFMTGSGGQESSSFLAEMRSAMKQRGLIKNTYDPVTPKLMEETYNHFKKFPALTYHNVKAIPEASSFANSARIVGFMKPTKSNFKLLSDQMNNLPVVAGAGLVGAGAIDAATGDESQGEQKQKKGGLVKAQAGLDLSHGFSWKDVESLNNTINQKLREERQQRGLSAQRDNTKQDYKINGSNKYTPKLTPLQIADEVTDIMQMGHFVPTPVTQWIGFAGDVIGAPIDAWQAGEAMAKGDYNDMATNLAFAASGAILGSKGYRRDMWSTTPGSMANRIASFGSRNGSYIPLTALPRLANNPVINRGINLNRGLLVNQGLETMYDSQYEEPTENSQPAERSYTNFFGPKNGLLPDEEWALKQGYNLETWRALPSSVKTKVMMDPKDKSMDFELRMKPKSTILKSKKKPYAFDVGGPTPKKAAQMLKDNSAHSQPLTDAQKRYFQLLINQKNKK